jgi:uncharacterized membrane protein
MRSLLPLTRRLVISGVLIILPLGFTLWILALVFRLVNGTVTVVVRRALELAGIQAVEGVWWGTLLPLVGLLVSIGLLMLVGLLGTNLVGKRVLATFERLLLSIPLVRGIYSGAKQLLDAITMGGSSAFREVVALEYPRSGCWVLGFVTSTTRGTLWGGADQGETVQVFVPTSPNPTSGFMLMLPADTVHRLEISVEEAIKMIVSGGLVIPSSLTAVQGGTSGPEPVPGGRA